MHGQVTHAFTLTIYLVSHIYLSMAAAVWLDKAVQNLHSAFVFDHDPLTNPVTYACYIFCFFSPERMGLLDPSTSDGRVIFFLPWQNVTLAGTTDNACDITFQPAPTEKEIQFILNEVRNYLHPDVEGMLTEDNLLTSLWFQINP